MACVQAGEQPGPKKKKQKSDKHAERGSSRPQRSRRGQQEGSPGPEQQPRHFVELNEDEIIESDADKNFIDDDGECFYLDRPSLSTLVSCRHRGGHEAYNTQ